MTAKNNAYKKASNQADKAQKTYDSYSTKKNQLTSQISKLKIIYHHMGVRIKMQR